MSPLEREWEKKRWADYRDGQVRRLDHATIIRRIFVKAPWYVRAYRRIRKALGV